MCGLWLWICWAEGLVPVLYLSITLTKANFKGIL